MAKPWLPSMPEIVREAIIVAAGALLAAAVVRMLPADKQSLFMLPGQGR